jgi:hypothetical protein
MEKPDASVIICTHNPRADYLDRVLAALRKQTLSVPNWELLVIDNASTESVAGRFDIGWHPSGRHVHEAELGLTHARLRGLAEARAELLVFLDDDNVLDADYLDQAMRIAREYPFLGVWGGQCVPEFEVAPSPELKPYLHHLALHATDRILWTNVAGAWSEAYAMGAGICVRREVLAEYARRTMACRLRQSLDRKGNTLLSGGDFDINLTACDMGLGCGVFHFLKLTHLIPAQRVTTEYLLRLRYAMSFSEAVLFTARGKPPADPFATRLRRVIWKARLRRQPYPYRDFAWAGMVGVHDGIQFCQQARTSAASIPVLSEPVVPRRFKGLNWGRALRNGSRQRALPR